jgi:hypothetical protein
MSINNSKPPYKWFALIAAPSASLKLVSTVRKTNSNSLNHILYILFVFILQSCASIAPNSDYVIVEPVKFVPCETNPSPNSSCGWVKVDGPIFDGYNVHLGDMKYHKIIEPLIANNTLTGETAVSAASTFVENEVVKRQLCTSAKVPAKARNLRGSQNPPEIIMYVECVKPK